MVTTNEQVGKVHPAISRPGRCAVLHEFDRLPIDDANAWLETRGNTARVTRATTMADLHALLDGRAASQTRILGFVGSTGMAHPAPHQGEDRGD